MNDLDRYRAGEGRAASRPVRRLALVLAGVGAVVGAVALLAVTGGGGRDTSGIEVGDRVPAYSAPDLAGREVSFADNVGRVVLVNVWATWCGPCRVEMPSIQSLYDAYADRGFTVMAISIDAGSGSKDAVQKYASEFGFSFPILLDRESRISGLLRTIGVPETFILDREGRIAKRVIGASDWHSEANRALIEELLKR